MSKKESTYIKEKDLQFTYKGSMKTLAQDIIHKKEGITIAYDENLFDTLYELADKYKKEPAQMLTNALFFGLELFTSIISSSDSPSLAYDKGLVEDGFDRLLEELDYRISKYPEPNTDPDGYHYFVHMHQLFKNLRADFKHFLGE